MGQIKIYGCSDDLIEIEGDIHDEFNGGDEPTYLQFNDGSVIEAIYNNEGIWRFNVVALAAGATFDKTPGTPEGDETDILTLSRTEKFSFLLQSDNLEHMPDANDPLGLACAEVWNSICEAMEELGAEFEYPDTKAEAGNRVRPLLESLVKRFTGS